MVGGMHEPNAYMGLCVRTLLALVRQQSVPYVSVHRSPPGGLGNGRGLHAGDRGQGAVGMAEDLHPEVGEAGAGMARARPAQGVSGHNVPLFNLPLSACWSTPRPLRMPFLSRPFDSLAGGAILTCVGL